MGDVQAVADELEIRNLLARLCFLADSGDIDDYMACYTDDAVWSMPAVAATGLPASVKEGQAVIREGVVERRAGGVQGPGTGTRHVLTTSAIELDGDTAAAESYYLFVKGSDVLVAGTYHDRFRRAGGGWKVAHREILMG